MPRCPINGITRSLNLGTRTNYVQLKLIVNDVVYQVVGMIENIFIIGLLNGLIMSFPRVMPSLVVNWTHHHA